MFHLQELFIFNCASINVHSALALFLFNILYFISLFFHGSASWIESLNFLILLCVLNCYKVNELMIIWMRSKENRGREIKVHNWDEVKRKWFQFQSSKFTAPTKSMFFNNERRTIPSLALWIVELLIIFNRLFFPLFFSCTKCFCQNDCSIVSFIWRKKTVHRQKVK